jgi:hypothetical protein
MNSRLSVPDQSAFGGYAPTRAVAQTARLAREFGLQ